MFYIRNYFKHYGICNRILRARAHRIFKSRYPQTKQQFIKFVHHNLIGQVLHFMVCLWFSM